MKWVLLAVGLGLVVFGVAKVREHAYERGSTVYKGYRLEWESRPDVWRLWVYRPDGTLDSTADAMKSLISHAQILANFQATIDLITTAPDASTLASTGIAGATIAGPS